MKPDMSRVLARRRWRDELFRKGWQKLYPFLPPQPIIAWPVVGGAEEKQTLQALHKQTDMHTHTQRER